MNLCVWLYKSQKSSYLLLHNQVVLASLSEHPSCSCPKLLLGPVQLSYIFSHSKVRTCSLQKRCGVKWHHPGSCELTIGVVDGLHQDEELLKRSLPIFRRQRGVLKVCDGDFHELRIRRHVKPVHELLEQPRHRLSDNC
jgi:hypothetical protein